MNEAPVTPGRHRGFQFSLSNFLLAVAFFGATVGWVSFWMNKPGLLGEKLIVISIIPLLGPLIGASVGLLCNRFLQGIGIGLILHLALSILVIGLCVSLNHVE